MTFATHSYASHRGAARMTTAPTAPTDDGGDVGQRRTSLKSSSSSSYRGNASAHRRAQALKSSQSRRRDALAYARAVVTGCGEDSDAHASTVHVDAAASAMNAHGDEDEARDGAMVDDATQATTSSSSPPSSSSSSSSGLTMPEWMWDDVPHDLSTKWYVRSRPRGARCLVVASKGKTITRSSRDGRTTATFQSALPGGSARTMRGRGSDCFCILDCVYAEDEKARKDDHHRGGGRTGKYYVLDVMAWNGAAMYDCDAEFRFFWAHTRLTQECEACERPDVAKGREFSFAMLPWYDADANGVRAAYAEDIGVERDGLLFYHKEAAYDVGVTPLVLLWRDAMTSRFFAHDEGASAVLARAGVNNESSPHIVSLAKSADGTFFITGDEPPLVITACDATPCASSNVVAHTVSLAPGRVGRFLARGFDVDVSSGVVRSADIAYLGPKPNATMAAADLLSKILFNARARTAVSLDIQRILTGASQCAPIDAAADDDMMM